jgi:hypothetical protein
MPEGEFAGGELDQLEMALEKMNRGEELTPEEMELLQRFTMILQQMQGGGDEAAGSAGPPPGAMMEESGAF